MKRLLNKILNKVKTLWNEFLKELTDETYNIRKIYFRNHYLLRDVHHSECKVLTSYNLGTRYDDIFLVTKYLKSFKKIIINLDDNILSITPSFFIGLLSEYKEEIVKLGKEEFLKKIELESRYDFNRPLIEAIDRIIITERMKGVTLR